MLEKGKIIRHNQVGTDLYEIELAAGAIVREAQPGQFIHLRVGDAYDPLLRRPLSIYDVDAEKGTMEILYRVVGKGTKLLTQLTAGEELDLMGPLGAGFSIAEGINKVCLIGGGVGIAPLVFLARRLRSKNVELCFLQGTRTRAQIVAEQRLQAWSVDHYIATQDGSCGYHGMVTDLLTDENIMQGVQFIYTCGPEPMMKAVQAWACQHHIQGELSLEEYMACGIGACLGCARKLHSQDEFYVKICKDGPVFGLHEVELYEGRTGS
ncbi:MAG TPA: dihydroorotate dehydrogenase electron transfer subunit [Syntrophomonadaceae bacterium]|nr:dihydroorotate dehydrogenase electron transfer subunit [Syntrophomonadaceae bacterium]